MTTVKSFRRFIYQGTQFDVNEEDDGKFTADVVVGHDDDGDDTFARVIGRFSTEGEAITASKGEINLIDPAERQARGLR